METKKYDIIDGIFALLIVIIQFIGYIILLNIYSIERITNGYSLYYNQLILYLIIIFLVTIYMVIRKQKVSSIGFTTKNFSRSLLTGLYYSIIYLLIFFLIHSLKNDFELKSDIEDMIIKLIYFMFMVALFEEVLFRGFINSRMRGLFRNKYLTIIAVSIIFSIMHLPFNSINYSDLYEYFYNHFGYHMMLCFSHFIFQYLYDKYNNIMAPFILHFIYDYFLWLFIGIK